MLPIETIALFFVTSVALGLTPGPDNIFVLTQSALSGRKKGVLVTAGLCTGLLIHTAAVSVGVAAIFQTSALAFTALKAIGAGYLLYLAWLAFRAKAESIDQKNTPEQSWRKLYVRGVVMNVTNPKVAIFFLAFLPQFADPALGSLTIQMLILGGVFIVATFVVFSIIAWSAGFLGERLRQSPKAQQTMNRMAGVVFCGLAFRLLATDK